MKAELKYNLPDENYEFSLATKAPQLAKVIFELDQLLRNKSKYDEIYTIEVDFIRKEIVRLCEENNVLNEVFNF